MKGQPHHTLNEVKPMKAIVLHEYGGPEKLKYEDVPDPTPGEGQVLVRVAAASINPIDWKMRSGIAKQHFPVDFPGILGRDVSGTVRSVGPKVEGFAPGDKVMALAWKTYAELCVVNASDLARVPDGLDLIEAAALPLVVITGQQLISLGANIQSGQTVLITGAVGSVGRSAVFVAKHAGAMVLAGVRKSQKEEAGELGADEVIAIDDDADINRLGFLDAVADAVNGETAQKLMGKVKQGGVFGSVLGTPANAKMHPTVRVQPITAKPEAAKLRWLAEQVAAGELRIPIDRMVPLEDTAKAHAAAEKGGLNGKILLLA
jgi:NADPH:quinone reductase-like Zn-dependent oxidoreductase